MPQFTGGNDTVSHLNGRNLDGLLANLSVERQEKLALLHGFLVGEHGLHGVVAAQQIRDGLIVTQHLFTLECSRLTLDGLLCAVLGEAQFGDYRHYRLLIHVFLRERTIDGCCHLSGFSLQRVGSYLEIVTCQLS